MIKKIIKYSLFVSIIMGIISPFCLGQWNGMGISLDSKNKYVNGVSKNCDTNLGECTSVKEKDNTIIVRLLGVFGLDTSRSNDLKFIDYARAILNLALGLISFIALIMAIYTFYMMFFSENEAGIKKAKGNLIGIFIALAIIGLAWIIVSFIFRWYQSNWKENEEKIGTQSDISEIGVFYNS